MLIMFLIPCLQRDGVGGQGDGLVWDAADGTSYTPSLVGETPLCPRGAGAGSARGPHSDPQ